MPDFSLISDKTTAFFLAFQHFKPHCRVLSLEMLGKGNINDTCLIRCEAGAFVLQRLNSQVFKNPAAVDANMALVEKHLKSNADYPLQVLECIADGTDKRLYKDDSGQYWRLFLYCENSYTPEGRVSGEMAYKAAQAFGCFARAMSGFPAGQLSEVLPGFHDSMARWEHFLEVLKQDPLSRVQEAKAEIEALFGILPVFQEVERLKVQKLLPVRVTHNDAKAGNVLFDATMHEARMVIDMDTVMPGSLLSDFGDLVRTLCPDRYEDETGSVALIPGQLEAVREGYLDGVGDAITALEMNQLMLGAKWIAGEQALRFLTDYLAGDVYYKVKDAQHNWRRARNQLGLFGCL